MPGRLLPSWRAISAAIVHSQACSALRNGSGATPRGRLAVQEGVRRERPDRQHVAPRDVNVTGTPSHGPPFPGKSFQQNFLFP